MDNSNIHTQESNTEAQELFLKAKYLYNHRSTNQDFVDIESLLRKSIQLDKNFADPHILYAEYYLVKNEYNKCLKFYESSLKIS